MLYCSTSVSLLMLLFKTQPAPCSTPNYGLQLHSKADKLYLQDIVIVCRSTSSVSEQKRVSL